MKTSSYLNSAVALGACLAMSGTAFAQTTDSTPTNELVTLRLNLRPGQKYRMTQVTQTKIATVAPVAPGKPDQKADVSSDSTSDIDYNVLYINSDGSAQVRLTYGAINVRSTVTVDGKPTPAAQAGNSPMQALKGKAIEMRISPTGQVSNVRGLDKIWKAALSQTSTTMTPAQQREFENAMKNTFGEKFFVSLMEQSGMSLPQEPVRIGGSWTHRINLSGGFMPVIANLRRTLQSRQNGALTIAENGTLSFGNSSKAMRVNDSSVMMLFSGNYNGTTILDEATGFVRSSQITQRLGGKQTVQGKGSTPPITMRMYMLMTSTTTTKNLN